MTNNPRKIVGLEGYGLEIVGREPIEVGCCATNEDYMRTKQEKMGQWVPLAFLLGRIHTMPSFSNG